MTVVTLREAAAEEAFGGKAASLAKAIEAGLPVPPGYAISWDDAERIAKGDPVAAETAQVLHRRLGAAVSVRSSAIGEDSAGSSFAGQHLTVLNVVSEEQLLESIRAVEESARSAAALSYRSRMGIEGDPRIAVVVQKMVHSDTAGVLFTRNPVTGASETVIEASWGLGEAVVAGLVTPDYFRVAADGTILESRAGIKDAEIVFAGAGTEEIVIAGDRVSQLCLDPAQILALQRLASRCETFFGNAIDLEWAIEKGELFLLQSRPITRFSEVSGGASAVSLPDPPQPSSPVPTTLTPRRLGGFAMAAILSPLNSTMIAVALPAIAGTFHSKASTLTLWLVSSYLLVSIIAQSPAGKLADLFGYSRVLTIGRVLFAIGALAGALAPSVAVLAVARLLMAIGGSLNVPPVMAELRNQVAPEKRGRLFGAFGAIMGTAAATGPLLGDFLMRHFGWHALFVVNLPVIVLSFLLEPPHHVERKQARAVSFDVTGSLLFAISIALLVGGVQMKSGRGLAAAMSGAVLFAIFAEYERRQTDPLIDLTLFRARPFLSGSAVVALQNFTMYAVLFLVPFLFTGHGQSRQRVGGLLLAMTGAMVVASPFGGRIADAIGARGTTVFGAMLATAGAALLFTAGREKGSAIVTALVLLGAGIGISTSPSQASALSAVERDRAGSAAGALSTMRYIGGVFGSAVVGLVVSSVALRPLVWVFPIALLASAAFALLLPARAPATPQRNFPPLPAAGRGPG